MLQSLIELAEKPWISLVIGTAIGLFSIVLSLILYRRSLIKSSLSYVKVEVEVLSVVNPTWEPDLDIKYKGVEISKLTAGRVGIWNSGNTTIEYDQVIASEPLIVSVPEGAKILVCHATAISRTVLNVRVEQPDNNQAKILFDFLDPGDGFMLHIAQSSPRDTLQVSGTIKGLPKGLTEFSVKGNLPLVFLRSSLLPALLAGVGMSLSATATRKLSEYYSFGVGSWQYNTIAFILIALVLVATVLSVISERIVQRRRSAGIPKAVRTDPVIAATMGLKV